MAYFWVQLPRSKNVLDDEKKAAAVVDHARALAKKRKLKFPKRVQIGGCYGDYQVYFCYGTKVVRDLLKEVVHKFGYTIIVR